MIVRWATNISWLCLLGQGNQVGNVSTLSLSCCFFCFVHCWLLALSGRIPVIVMRFFICYFLRTYHSNNLFSIINESYVCVSTKPRFLFWNMKWFFHLLLVFINIDLRPDFHHNSSIFLWNSILSALQYFFIFYLVILRLTPKQFPSFSLSLQVWFILRVLLSLFIGCI